MYYIYVDEAGTSAQEPVTIVAGVIIQADTQWRRAQEMIAESIREFVPRELQKDFVFHAKTIWGGNKENRNLWKIEDRIKLIGAIASIPRKLQGAVAVGKVRRDAPSLCDPTSLLSKDEIQHIVAFTMCVARANKYIRDWANPNEVATIVCEDVPNKRRFLKRTTKFTLPTYPLDDKHLHVITGFESHSGPVDRIVDTVYFAEKDEAPLLQIADACAFCFRRYLAGQKYGGLWIKEMLGFELVWDQWQGPSSEMVFSFNQQRTYVRSAFFGGGLPVFYDSKK